MARMSSLMLLPPIIFAGLAALFVVGLQRDNPNALPSAQQGKEAPAVVLTELGEALPFTDATLREPGVKLVNYWASWCVPCRVEHPTLTRLAAEGIPIYGVNYKDRPEHALRFLSEMGNPFRAMGADEKGRMALNWGVYGVPETYVIDGDGVILTRIVGPVTSRVLAQTLRPALAAARKTAGAKN